MEESMIPNLIEYDFEIEKETRLVMEPGKIEDFNWINHVLDVYDKSGRARIRIKNGKPRFSVKVPLFSKDTDKMKTCIRIELKPRNRIQEEQLLQMRELILAEEGCQVSEKWGAPVENEDGTKIWINRDSAGNWWIEVDEGATLSLPETIKILGSQKSGVRV